jgi:hypothetical protein
MGDDLAVYYTCSRVWLHGGNPYDLAVLTSESLKAGGAPSALLNDALNPPCTFVLMAPLGLLDWPAARAAWLGVNLLSLAMVLWGLVRLVRPDMTPARAILLAALVLGLAPVQTSVALGQMILPVTGLVVWGIVAQRGGRCLLAGALFAMAAAMKPQVGAVFLTYLLLRGRWRPFVAGAVVGAVLLGSGVLRIELAGQEWLEALRANHDAFFHGGRGDLACPMRHQFLHLQYPLLALLGSRIAAGAIAWGIVAALGAGLLWFVRRGPAEKGELLAYGIVSALSLLVVYHRLFDATILLIPAAWALAAHPPTTRPYARGSVLLILPFLLPGPAMLYVLGDRGGVPGWVVDSWWWQGIILPHQVWLVLGLAVVLTAALARSTRHQPGSVPASPNDQRIDARSATI